jgi:hypothetical protein
LILIEFFYCTRKFPPWVGIFDGFILKNIEEIFSEMPKTIFWNEAIKVKVRHNRKPIRTHFYNYYSAKGLFLLLHILEHQEEDQCR